jgi:hypothetical protein
MNIGLLINMDPANEYASILQVDEKNATGCFVIEVDVDCDLSMRTGLRFWESMNENILSWLLNHRGIRTAKILVRRKGIETKGGSQAIFP